MKHSYAIDKLKFWCVADKVAEENIWNLRERETLIYEDEHLISHMIWKCIYHRCRLLFGFSALDIYL